MMSHAKKNTKKTRTLKIDEGEKEEMDTYNYG